ncbi:hypothetical protein FACS18949_12000 [Clostridia bacterium]|nr:hypothetical protein FACS189425_04440 [Clostridia bacterium]GHV34965.1 hypothetical protein FACS18949_12000 [Clostridia bacterium]
MNETQRNQLSERRIAPINGAALMKQKFAANRFLVDSLLSQGLYVLAGKPKIGKSWLALQLCLAVAKGENFINLETKKAGALYFCLEDGYARIQARLPMLTDSVPSNTHFINISSTIGNGLEEDIENFVSRERDVRLVVIDTLQIVRAKNSSYADDYRELCSVKSLADRLGITILFIHHVNKGKLTDPFDTISGTNGILGSCDGGFVLIPKERGESEAVLYATSRDFEERKINLAFSENCQWNCADDDTDIVAIVKDFLLRNGGYFSNTATVLLELLGDELPESTTVNSLSRLLGNSSGELSANGVEFKSSRTKNSRNIDLRLIGDDS